MADDPLTHARTFTRLMESVIRIPGTSIRIGLDPLLGLVPGLGDAAGAALAGYLVVMAARLGAPAAVVARMIGNVALDTAAGSLPVLGDLFDFAWKSNSKNLALLERYLEQPERTTRSSTALLAGALAAVVALGAAGVVLSVMALRALLSLFQ